MESKEEKIIRVYSCSGSANTGYLSDAVGRALRKQIGAKGSCAVAVGSGNESYIKKAKDSDINIVIDGCPVACTKKIFDDLGLPNVKHYEMTDFGVKKKVSEITPQIIESVTNVIIDDLQSN